MQTNNKNSLLLTPTAGYFIGFVLPWVLLKFNFVDSISDLSRETDMIILISIISYYFGLIVSQRFSTKPRVKNETTSVFIPNEKLAANTLIAWTSVGIACLLYEFYSIGMIPLFSGSDWERVRFELQVNGYVHLIAISTGMAALMAAVLYTYSNDSKQRRIYGFVAVIGIISLVLTGNRSDFLIPVVIFAVFYVRKNKLKVKVKNLLITTLFIIAFGLIKITREELSGSNYIEMMRGQITDTDPSFLKILLYPIYMTFAYSYQVFDWLVMSNAAGSSSGEYTFYSIYSLLASNKISFGDFKNSLLGIDFYGELTSTYISNFYLDFGTIGCAIGSMLTGYIVNSAYQNANNDLRYDIMYSLIYVYLVISFYSFMYYYFYCVLQVLITVIVARFILKNSYNQALT